MKSPEDFYPYQRKMIQHIIDHPFCGIYADMGLGKTSTTLTALLKLIRTFEVGKILIVAPLRVARKTWTDELSEWSHLADQFTVSKILGTPQQRMAGIAADADIYMINRENFTWLCEQYRPKSSRKLLKPWPWEMVVIDESSSFKSQGSERWKSWRRVRTEIDRMIHLTGSPAPKGLKDLWAPMYMLDGGERLGSSEGAFERRWFDRIMQHPKDQYGKLQPKPGAEKEIYALISNICISLVADDYLELPNVVLNWIPVTLSKPEMAQYKELARTSVLEMKTKTITAVNAGVLAGKLLQAANGAIYTDHPAWESFHDRKLEALQELLADNVNKNFMIMYEFKSDLDRVSAMLSKMKGITWRKLETEQDEDDWNAGRIDYLLLHPACLHPSTEVLTEHRGWISLINVNHDERVYDGVEFVSHDGCAYSGYQEIIDVFGIEMTTGHKLLIADTWEQAKNVRNIRDSRRKALYEYSGDESYLIEMFALRRDQQNTVPERSQAYAFGGVLSGDGFEPNGVDGPAEQRHDSRRSGTECSKLDISQEQKKAHVYDLVNCGPRNRFLIRNTEGEVFVSHNSAGHGLNLQHGGELIIWFGLNWSLELYTQANARLIGGHRRKGKAPIIHHIIAEGTYDERVRSVLENNQATQDDLMGSIKMEIV